MVVTGHGLTISRQSIECRKGSSLTDKILCIMCIKGKCGILFVF